MDNPSPPPPPLQQMVEAQGNRASSSPSLSSLHSVRKPPAKPWKKPTAPPVPPKVYRVEPRGFRELVQRLTGAPESAPRCLRDAAPAPLHLAPRPSAPQPPLPPPPPPHVSSGQNGSSSSNYDHWVFMNNAKDTAPPLPPPPKAASGHQSPASLAGFLSPSLYSAWFNFPLLSPGSMACLEQSTVL